MVGRNSQNALYIHYSNLCFNRVYRSINIFCKNNYYIHGIYAPICEDELGVKAGVVLSNGSKVIETYFFDEDDNMLDMMNYALISFKNNCNENYVSSCEIFKFSDSLKNVLRFDNRELHLDSLNEKNQNFDLMQLWLLEIFMATKLESEPNFLSFLEKLNLRYFNNKNRDLVEHCTSS